MYNINSYSSTQYTYIYIYVLDSNSNSNSRNDATDALVRRQYRQKLNRRRKKR